MRLSIDFETRAREKIDSGVYRYSPDAEIMCVSWSWDAGRTIHSWRMGDPEPTNLTEPIRQGKLVEARAFNAAFERVIWQTVCVEKMGWPEIPFDAWRCTMAEALAANIAGGLGTVGEITKADVQKDMKARRIMLKMSKPRKPTKKDKSVWHDKPADWDTLLAYCDDDVRAECDVASRIPRLSDTEQRVYQFDQLVNDRGVYVDRDLVESALGLWQQNCERHWAELARRTDGELDTTNKAKAITAYLNRNGIEADSVNKESVTKLLADETVQGTPRYVLQLRQDLALSSIAKYAKMIECMGSDNRIRGLFQYHGASQTGRWAGRMVQIQNLPRGIFQERLPKHLQKPGKIDPLIESLVGLIKSRDIDLVEKLSPMDLGDTLSGAIRNAIMAAPGKVLRVCDFSGVEARALAWMAGEEWLLESFVKGTDIYKDMAAEIYHKRADQVTKPERHIGKSAILGCGYSMGAARFKSALAESGVEESLGFCERVVKTYRRKNSKIRAFWYAMERAAVSCVQTKQARKIGNVTFWWDEPWLCMRLPSGRDIRYYNAHLKPGRYGPQIHYTGLDPNTGRVTTLSTYSGKLVENCIQAICRDLLVFSMSTLHKAGYYVIGHVHDEIITEDDPSFGSIGEVERLMCELPKWASGFPVGVEGFEANRYRK